MHRWMSLLSLPASLLLLLPCAPAQTSNHKLQWPYNLPPHIKYHPEDEYLVRRDLQIQQRLAYQMPAEVEKMSGDEGEKFLMTYWHFELQSTEGEQGQNISAPILRRRDWDSGLWANASIPQPLQPPFLLHTDQQQTSRNPHFLHLPHFAFPSLQKRAFQCPSGTSNCSAIGRPDSCCSTGETCQLITDTGLGDVGCCGVNLTCAGEVTVCDIGLTSCPNNTGGGCCIPDYECVDVGCKSSPLHNISPTPIPYGRKPR